MSAVAAVGLLLVPGTMIAAGGWLSLSTPSLTLFAAREVCVGGWALVLWWCGEVRALGWLLMFASIIPVEDGWVTLHHTGAAISAMKHWFAAPICAWLRYKLINVHYLQQSSSLAHFNVHMAVLSFQLYSVTHLSTMMQRWEKPQRERKEDGKRKRRRKRQQILATELQKWKRKIRWGSDAGVVLDVAESSSTFWTLLSRHVRWSEMASCGALAEQCCPQHTQ